MSIKYRIIHKILSILKIKFLEVVYLAPARVAGPQVFEATLLSADQLRSYVTSGLLGYAEEDISRVEKEIAICIAVIDQGRLAGICWYAIKPYPHTKGYTAYMHPDYVCGYGLNISHEYRGQGIHAVLVQRVQNWMAAHNKKGLLLAINFDNLASRRSAEKMGFSKLGWSFYSPWLKFRVNKIRQYYSIDG